MLKTGGGLEEPIGGLSLKSFQFETPKLANFGTLGKKGQLYRPWIEHQTTSFSKDCRWRIEQEEGAIEHLKEDLSLVFACVRIVYFNE